MSRNEIEQKRLSSDRERVNTVHLRTGGTSVVLQSVDGRMPTMLHWGRRLEDVDLPGLVLGSVRSVPNAALNEEVPLGLVTELGDGFPGSPGIVGHRSGGHDYAPAFSGAEFSDIPSAGTDRSTVTCRLTDRNAELAMELELSLGLADVTPPETAAGSPGADVLAITVTLTNTGGTDYVVDRLAPSVSLPSWASELLTFSGRWTLELQAKRHQWGPGVWSAENWRGRTSHDRPPALFAGTQGFGETSGEVWGMQLGWSGNNRIAAERLSDGRRHVQLGELLFSGELVLEPGRSVTAPTVYGAYSADGLGEVSLAFHRLVRSRSHHPGVDRPRPVLLNTWEAVYFNHDMETLKRLASLAAEVGVERFVVDDGWFLGRNDDTAALGDWFVDPVKYPDGLDPLIDHVRSLGMEFGLWFEPEMINPDSDLYRAHPEWALHDPRYPMRLGRNQLVLDLVNPDAWKHIAERLNALLSEHDISYIKWDMNRDLVRPTLPGGAGAGARGQTLAYYALVDEIRRLHPNVEIESCSSGGARADLEVLSRTERIWASDSNDALDRQTIHRGFTMLFPPEVMGAHIGPPVSHTTSRHHDLSFRAASAILGHLGIEWNLLTTNEQERAELAEIIALHKEHRALLHSGQWRRLETADPAAVSIMGVVSQDRAQAFFVYSRTGTSLEAVQPAIRFTGLDPDRLYLVLCPPLPGRIKDREFRSPQWFVQAMTPDTAVPISGRVLMEAGLQPPILDPESVLLLHLKAQ